MGLIPGQGTKIPCAAWRSQKKKKKSLKSIVLFFKHLHSSPNFKNNQAPLYGYYLTPGAISLKKWFSKLHTRPIWESLCMYSDSRVGNN